MENRIISYVLIIGTFLFGLYVLLFFVPFGLWLKAKISGVPMTLLDLIYLKMCRVAPSPIVKSMILAAKEGIEIQKEALEDHSRAGGNVENVVTGMIIAKRKKAHLSFKEACQLDLTGRKLIKD